MDPFTLQCDAIPGRPRVLAFRGDEELGRSFEYDVYFTVGEHDALALDPERVLGKGASLTIGVESGAAEVSGCVAEIELLEDVPSAVFRMRVVPPLWFLRRSAHNRVFVDESVPDILSRVLTQAGLAADAFELRLDRRYKKREHVCQYQESDLDFVERWMQREGLYYFFDHGAPGSKLVICDSPSDHAPGRADPIAYHPVMSADESSGQHFRVFRASLTALPKEVAEADYNYLTPDTKVDGSEPVATELGAEVRRWAVNEADADGAARVAKLRAELELSRRTRYVAKGRELSIHAGFTFGLERHPAAELDREYLAVRVVRWGQLSAPHDRIVPFFTPEEAAELGRELVHVEIEAIASDVQFRPARRTPWPRAAGLELGLVDGADDSDYAQLDEHGRYLVKLMMDENPSPAGKASARIRMIQPHGGKQEGWHLPLRKGTEVLIAFIGGDPDRPVIAAAVPNALTPSPVTRANSTKNVLQTGGESRIEIEDLPGQQYIDVSTPPESTFLHLGAHAGLGDHNVVLSTSGDGRIETGTNRDVTIGGDQNEDIQGNLTESYHANQTTHVAAAFQETLDAGATQTIHAGLDQTITGGLDQKIDGGEQRSVSGGVTETINGSRIQTIDGGAVETVSATQTQTIGGGATIKSGGTYTIKADGGITLKTDGPMNMMANTWHMNAPGGQLNVDNFFVQMVSMDVRMFDIMCTPNLAAVNIIGVALSATAARIDVIMMRKAEFAGAVLQNRGMVMEAGVTTKSVFGATFALGFLTFL
jgi:type VI secretion system secreted protein VgrG